MTPEEDQAWREMVALGQEIGDEALELAEMALPAVMECWPGS